MQVQLFLVRADQMQVGGDKVSLIRSISGSNKQPDRFSPELQEKLKRHEVNDDVPRWGSPDWKSII